MFRKSNNNKQSTFFDSNTLFKGTPLKNFEDSSAWHNLFREQVTERIDEEIFRPLYCENNGTPNASIRVLVAMIILKDAYGMSNSVLLERVQYCALVRSALGLFNFYDQVPSRSTYYLFIKHILDREKAGLGNLMSEVYSSITKSQIMEFNINGSKIRMDSTLFGSNIAWCSRYELVHETLRLAYAKAKSQINTFLTKDDIAKLQLLFEETAENVSYHSNKAELVSKLTRLGQITYSIVKSIPDRTIDAIDILHRVFYEQYEVINDIVQPLPKQAIKASSVQSPHDPDCHFRTKGQTDVKGYSVNITETCDENNDVNLITNVIVEPATISDIDFFQKAIEDTQSVLHDKIESINADGAYHSPENQEYCKENEIDFIINALSGPPPRYDLYPVDNDNLIVFDNKLNKFIAAEKPKLYKGGPVNSWYIITEKLEYKYFNRQDLANSELRRQIASRPRKERNRRNNVEASVFQFCYHLSGKKSRYRGLIRHRLWAFARCIWINFVRIMKYLKKNGMNPIIDGKMMAICRHFLPFFAIIYNFIQNIFYLREIPKFNKLCHDF